MSLAFQAGIVTLGCHCVQEAGIPRKAAPTIGIAVDHRRRNRSLESLQVCSCLPVLLVWSPGLLVWSPVLRVWTTLPAGLALPLAVARARGPPGAPERLYAKRWCGTQENVNRLKAYKASLVLFPRRSKKPKAGDTASKEEREGVPQVTGRLQPLVRAARTAELETAEITEEMQVRPGALCEKCPERWSVRSEYAVSQRRVVRLTAGARHCRRSERTTSCAWSARTRSTWASAPSARPRRRPRRRTRRSEAAAPAGVVPLSCTAWGR